NNKEPQHFSSQTVIGALINYITSANENNFQPMNANWGIVANSNKNNRENSIQNSLEEVKEYLKNLS
ncbi:MAG: FADH(2)-oxidizing methylenetetrahydrofolate--tRNA-(uracil(54)-C(5))-methyltransferase TrmFO, partial [Clostridia bacterium]|nr:FADH(2)-oxidizing methylenetetrahydrofolate--tRNA-(uracil(54)-C(5))-methyltransferase TrmFO [Clostridia bacterium]